MKALSLRQPWAELILQGRKKIETRTWNTHFRGRFLIHAANLPDGKHMESFGFAALPSGCIVGEATLVSVKKYNTKLQFDKDIPLHQVRLKEWKRPLYGYMLEDVKRLPQEKCKGMLNFFEARY